MEQLLPKISIIIPTYNRSGLVVRAVDSVLNQTYQDFEIILINNGSEDDTAQVLQQYDGNPKVKLFTLEKNIRYVGAFNFGIKQLKGEWFSELADDDWLGETALEVLIKEVKRDPTITAVSCNAQDNRTGELLGKGLDESQYLKMEDVVSKTSGQFWGLTKTEFIKDSEMPEGIPGFENVFWFKLEAQSKRYYVHQALHFFNVDEHPTMTQMISTANIKTKAASYHKLIHEDYYWNTLKKYNRKRYLGLCLRGFLFLKMAGYNGEATVYENKVKEASPGFKYRIYSNVISNSSPSSLDRIYQFLLKSKVSQFLNFTILGKHSQIVE